MLTGQLDLSSLPQELGEPVSKLQMRQAIQRAQLLRLAMKGLPAAQACGIVGCSVETARKHYSDPSFRKEVLERVENAFGDVDRAFVEQKKTLHEKLAEQAERAFEELVSLLEAPDTATGHKIKIAQDFLDRNPETQAGFVTRHAHVNAEQLAVAARTAREMDNVIPFERKEKLG